MASYNFELKSIIDQSVADQAQRSAERAANLDRYQVKATDEQYAIINSLISQTEDPVEAENQAYRAANAIKYSQIYGMPVDEAYLNLDQLNAAQFGEGRYSTPKDWFTATCDAWQQGLNQLKRNDIGHKIRISEENGNFKLDDLEAELAAIDAENEQLDDKQSRNWVVNCLKYGAQSAPFTGQAIVAGSFGALLGGGIGAAVLGTTYSWEAMRGEEYLQLREDGASVETAGRVADTAAFVNAIVETALGEVMAGVGTVAGKALTHSGTLSKHLIDKATKDVFKSMYYGGGWKKAAAIMTKTGLEYLSEATEEGIEEVVQELVSSYGRSVAASMDEYEADPKIRAEVGQRVAESFKGGFCGALVLGITNAGFNARATVKDFKAVDSMAKLSDSEETFNKATEDSPIFEGMTAEAKKEVQHEIYAKNENARAKLAEEKRNAALNKAETIDVGERTEETVEDESAQVVRGDAYRTKEGKLNYSERVIDENENGSTDNEFLVKGKGKEEYGRIIYNMDGDNVTITDFTLSPTRENLRQEVFTDFAEKFAGKNIEWETRSADAAAVKQSLIDQNTRGSKNGLNYFESEKSSRNQRARISILQEIKAARPNATNAELITDLAMVESRAAFNGKSIADVYEDKGRFVRNYMTASERESTIEYFMEEDGISREEAEKKVDTDIGGFFSSKDYDNTRRGFIYISKNSNPQTFMHEYMHSLRHDFSQEENERAAKALGVADPNNWTREEEEKLVDYFTKWAVEGKTEKPELVPLFKKIANALAALYKNLLGNIELNKEITDFFDSLFADPTNALAQARAAVYQMDQAENLNNKTTEETSINEEIIADDTLLYVDRTQAAMNECTDMLLQLIPERYAQNIGKDQAIERAKEMYAEGVSLENIYALHKVVLSNTGEWLYETDDTNYVINDKVDVNNVIIQTWHMAKVMKNAIENIGKGNLVEVYEKIYRDENVHFQEKIDELNEDFKTLGDLYSADELYKLNPALKDLRVGFMQSAVAVRAVQVDGGIAFNLSHINNADTLKQSIAYEVQLIIQKGMATNEESANFWNSVADAMRNHDKSKYGYDEVNNTLSDFFADPYVQDAIAAKERVNMSIFERRANAVINEKEKLNDKKLLYSIIGEQGATALDEAEDKTERIDNLAIAQVMEQEGKDYKTIRLATGWEKGVDGKWRYEIDDSKVNYDVMYSYEKNNPRFTELSDKLVNQFENNGEPLTDEELKEWDKLTDDYNDEYIWRTEGQNDPAYNIRLEDVLDDKDLFTAYPELSQVKVIVSKEGDNRRYGSYNHIENKIKLYVNKDNVHMLKSILLHEVQHAIQIIEGFAQGGNQETVNGSEIAKNINAEFDEIVKDIESTELFKEAFNKRADEYGRDRRGWASHATFAAYEDIGFNYFEADEKRKRRIERLLDKFTVYQSLSGEVEARNVQSRMTLSEAIRRETALRDTEDVAREDQILLFQDVTKTDNFKNWFGDWENDPENASKVVDAIGKPKVVYHGTARGDRVGSVFDPKRATSGPMAFFTDDKTVAESYSKNKKDTSLERDYESYDDIKRFKVKIGKKMVSIEDAWWYLDPEQRVALRENSGKITTDEDENIIVDENNEDGLGNFAYIRKQYRGDIIKALYDHWVMSGKLFGDDIKLFPEVLKKAGLDNVTYDDPNYREEKVYEVYLNIRNPFITSEVSQELVDALHEAGKKAQRKYNRENSTAVDNWDKSSSSPEEWIQEFDSNYAEGTTYVWTSIPDWVTKVLKDFGYDGIQDDGGKYHPDKHNVYIPFNSYQIKSAYENRGTFDPTKKNILYQTVYHGSAADFDRFDTENYGFSGEGSMSFGYGTYVTGSEKIARDYAMRQANDKYLVDMANNMLEHIESGFRTFEEEKQYVIEWYSKWKKYSIENPVRAKELKAKYDFAKSLNSLEDLKNASNPEGKRRLYTIDIPDDGYIKWDDTISSKTIDKIKEGLFNKLAYEPNSDGEYEYKGVEKELKRELDDAFQSVTGQQLYNNVAIYLSGERNASRFLNSIGYTGIDYPAGTNFGTPDGKEARNYVIFDDRDAKIVDKLVFQYLQNKLDRVTLEEAASFETWEEWYSYAQTMDDEGVVTGAWDAVAEKEWFKTAWEYARSIYSDNTETATEPITEPVEDMDSKFLELMKKPGEVDKFVEQIRKFSEMAEGLSNPIDADEAAQFDEITQQYGFINSQLQDQVFKSAELNDSQRKKILSEIKKAPKVYRGIYADVFNDQNYAVPIDERTKVDTFLELSEDTIAQMDRLTPAQRAAAIKELEDNELKAQIESGTLKMDGTIDRYIEAANDEIETLKKQVQDLQNQYTEALSDIKNQQKHDFIEEYNRLLEMYDQIKANNMKMEKPGTIEDAIKAGEKGSSNISEGGNRGRLMDIQRRMEQLQTLLTGERDAIAVIEKAKQKEEYKQKLNEKLKQKAIKAEVRRMRNGLVKSITRKVSFKNVYYDDAKKIIAAQNFVNDWITSGVNQWIGTETPFLRSVYSRYITDEEARKEILDGLSKSRSRVKAQKAIALLENARNGTGPQFDEWTAEDRRNLHIALGKTDWAVALNLGDKAKYRAEALHGMVDKNGNVTDENMALVKQILPPEIIANIMNKPMAGWTLEEMEALAKIIDQRYTEGKKVLAGMQQQRRDELEAIRDQIERIVKDTGIVINPDDSDEDKKKKSEKIRKILGLRTQVKGTAAAAAEKRSLRERFMAADRGTGNARRFARVMDNYTEDVFTTTLCFREYMAYDEEMKHLNERSRKVETWMKENGVTISELQQKHVFPGLMAGEDAEFTTDALLYIYVADQDEMSRAAVMYGNFGTAAEKQEGKRVDAIQDYAGTEWFRQNASARYEEVMSYARQLVSKSYKLKGLVNLIERDYAAQYDRLNEASIMVFNTPVNRVESYVPLYRKEMTGEENEKQVMRDIMADTTGAPSSYVNRGMTMNRVKINPLSQMPVELGLFKTWADSSAKTEHFIAYGGYVRDLNAIFTTPSAAATREVIASRYGDDANRYIKSYINELANPNKGNQRSYLDEWVRVMRGKTAPAYLSWKVSGIIKQLCTSPWPFMTYVSPASYLASMAKFMVPGNNMSEIVKEKSVFMANRTIDPIIDLIKEAEEKADNKTKALFAQINKTGMAGLEWADWFSVAPGWYAAYENTRAMLEKQNEGKTEVSDGYLTDEEIEKQAVAKADDIVRLTQPSGRKADIAPLFKNGSEIANVVLQFQTALNCIYQQVRFDIPYQIHNKQYGQVVRTIIGYTMAGIVVNAVVSGFGDDDDDEKDKLKNAVFFATTQFTDAVPVVGSIVTTAAEKAITGEGRYFNSNLFPVVEALKKTTNELSDGDFRTAAELFGQGVAYYLGMPVSGLKELKALLGIGDDDGKIELKPEALWGRR